MRKDILYFTDLNEFYQMLTIDNNCLTCSKIRKTTNIQADYIVWKMSDAADRHYIELSSKDNIIDFRKDDLFETSQFSISRISFSKRKIRIYLKSIEEAKYKSLVIPVVRKMFPTLIAEDLLPVQSLPQGAFGIYNSFLPKDDKR